MGIWIRFVVGVRLWTPSGPVMNVVVKLGSSLRDRVPEFSGGEGEVELPGLEAGSVRDVMKAQGAREQREVPSAIPPGSVRKGCCGGTRPGSGGYPYRHGERDPRWVRYRTC